MAGYATDSETLILRVVLPTGDEVKIVGENDGVNGYTWTGLYKGLGLPVDVDHRVLVDGICDPAED